MKHIRNFCIIAHIDHGKSTLADRMLQATRTIRDRDFRDQVLDDMDLERERGITIKSHPVTMNYRAKDGTIYEFNLIDTPGHVDFTYEVSRSMAACEGALLIVDAAQGVEAQTVANTHMAVDQGLEIIPILNKIDLGNADVDGCARQIEDVLAISMDDGLQISAKTGKGVEEVMEAIVRRVPPPATDEADKQTRALVFDSVFDAFKGVVTYVRVFDGELRAGSKAKLMGSGKETTLKEVGIFTPKPDPVKVLKAGQVGYLVGTIKEPSDIQAGDTVTTADRHMAKEALPGFKKMLPMVFSGLYPVNTADYEKLKHSLDRLRLNDSAFSYQQESSAALGFGFRCGFLGLLHMEIVQERLRREFNVDIINTYPSVIYRIKLTNGKLENIDNPVHLPELSRIEHIEEPMIKAHVLCHNEHIGDVMRLIRDRRGLVDRTESIDTLRVMLTCTLPLNEILIDFHDKLKSVSRGYSSMDYDYAEYMPSDLVKLDILVNGELVDAFSCLIHKSKAEARGRALCKTLKDSIPQHLFAVPIQAAIGKTIIARETIRALRKDVTAKLYGGDYTRKMKVLEKQKAGKKRMKQIGSVNVPQQVFVSVLKTD